MSFGVCFGYPTSYTEWSGFFCVEKSDTEKKLDMWNFLGILSLPSPSLFFLRRIEESRFSYVYRFQSGITPLWFFRSCWLFVIKLSKKKKIEKRWDDIRYLTGTVYVGTDWSWGFLETEGTRGQPLKSVSVQNEDSRVSFWQGVQVNIFTSNFSKKKFLC